MRKKVSHDSIKPIYNQDSEVLILGTIPSPKSRELGFYYAHPQNRFWKVLSDIYGEILLTNEEKIAFLLKHHIALWDVVDACEIDGANDSSITSIIPSDIAGLINKTNIHTIFTTGKKADSLYQKYCLKSTRIKSICLPSTSPANCAVKYEELKRKYSIIKECMSI